LQHAAEASTADDRLARSLGAIGLGILRYGLVFLLILWGAFKFTAVEANGIQPLVEHSPYLGWLYGVFGVRGTSALFGVFEMSAGVLIATRRWLPRVSGYASLAAAGLFVATLSFLFTTPGALALTSPVNGFLLKDIVLLGAALLTAAEALGAARETSPGARD
jgi:reactive chlorine resistance protein C